MHLPKTNIKKQLNILRQAIKTDKKIKPITLFIIVYGLLLNYTGFVLLKIIGLNAEFSLWTFPAYGIAFWFLKEELSRVYLMYKEK